MVPADYWHPHLTVHLKPVVNFPDMAAKKSREASRAPLADTGLTFAPSCLAQLTPSRPSRNRRASTVPLKSHVRYTF